MICLGNGIGVSGMIGLAQRLPYARTRQPPAGDEALLSLRKCATGAFAADFVCSLLPAQNQSSFRASSLFISKKNGHPSGVRSFLERATRLELATSTLARSRSTR